MSALKSTTSFPTFSPGDRTAKISVPHILPAPTSDIRMIAPLNWACMMLGRSIFIGPRELLLEAATIIVTIAVTISNQSIYLFDTLPTLIDCFRSGSSRRVVDKRS